MASIDLNACGLFIVVAVLAINLSWWLSQFVDLMMMPDEDFPGRFDKIIWVATFLVLFLFVAPFAFSMWKDWNRRRLSRLRSRTITNLAPPEEKAQGIVQEFER